MHDIRTIRDDPNGFDAVLARRGLSPMSAAILDLDARRREAITAAETAQAERNAASKDVGQAKARGDEAEFERLRALVQAKKDEVVGLEAAAREADAALDAALAEIPNAPLAAVPDGADEDDNVEIARWGEPREFDFPPKEHYELGAAMGLMDFETAAKLSGARFMMLSGALARLHRAIAGFFLDTQVDENGLTEVWTPALVLGETLYGTGNLPKFADDLYRVSDDMWLIPTSEATLTNIPAGQILEESYLPRRYTAWTQCFRREAGSAGKDTAGMLRQHQFEKVEMVSIVRPEDGEAEHRRMTGLAEDLLRRLGIPYRTVVLCTGDMGFAAAITHDIEAWLPGQGRYREISSCSLCTDFQARRMNARFRREGGKKPEFVHTLNGSGLAVGRALIAVMENGQQADGSIVIPEVLVSRMGGATRIGPDGTAG